MAPLTTAAAAPPAAPNPARERGLQRAPRDRVPCEPADWTPMPAPVDEVHLLALLTRVRQARIDSGEIKRPQGGPGQTSRLYDVRAHKCVLAELAYLRRLRKRATGGTIVTSMPQLVVGLARLHPAWKMDGDKFADRDRHHRSVRRRLRDLQDMGLLHWTPGLDVNGEEARTELHLLEAPDVTVDEQAAAAAQLQRWRRRYGNALNTGSSTGIRDARRHGRPLAASERQRRGIARARAGAQSRVRASTTNSHPHFEAPATPENSSSTNQPATDDSACSSEQARARQWCRDATPELEIAFTPRLKAPETTSLSDEGPDAVRARFEATRAARFARFQALREARQPVFDVIASHSDRRASEVASWDLDRGWPKNRVREAFAVWRYGAMHVAEHSWDAAGALTDDDIARLRRAVTRYERYAAARPSGYPAGGLAALAEIAATAAERGVNPHRLHYAIRALDQLTRRMRASETTDAADRHASRAKRAQRRRFPAPAPGLQLHYRVPRPGNSAWPPWVQVDGAGNPLLVDGDLVVRDAFRSRPGYEHQPWVAPPRSSEAYRETLRDAFLLRGLWPPIDTDGRSAMSQLDDRGEDGLAARRAVPGPYALPEHWRTTPDVADLELARLAPAMGLRRVQRLDVDVRDQLLDELRARARADAAERADIERSVREVREFGPERDA